MVPAIEMRGVRVEYRGGGGVVRALDGLDLTVQTGHVFGFLGPNGAGKTTAMHVLLGFIEPAAGEARLLGEDARRAASRERIGYLPENPDAYRFLTGRELLAFSGRLFRMRGRALRDRVARVLDLVGLDEAAAARRIATYSRGMMQRICLGQALVNDPDIVILDEPTNGLDPFARMAFREIIRGLRARGKTVFFSSHELSEVELVCDRLAIIAGGRLVTEGAASGLVPEGERLERHFMRVVEAARERKA
ncbi:MAG: ABC transporter ATP-binding protein [Lentisphaerae bacterium]|nr:ABC transporter ATP-binding protein [Lentisphaerota bacterium]